MPERNPDFRRARAVRDRFDWAAPYLREGAVLDLGCVDERHPERIETSFHARLRGLNPRVVGADSDPAAIEEARRRGFEIRLADAERDPLGGPYDAIFAGELVEHLANPGALLENVRRHLKPRGLLLLTTPNPFSSNQFAKILKYGRPQMHAAHRLWLDPQTLSVLLAACRFEIVDFVWLLPQKGPLRSLLGRLRRYWLPGFGVAARAE